MFRAQKAKFDERLSLIGLILDAVNARIRDFTVHEASMKRLVAMLREIGNQCRETDKDGILAEMETMQQKETAHMKRKSTAGTLSTFDKKVTYTLISILKELEKDVAVSSATSGEEAYERIKKSYAEKLNALKQNAVALKSNLENIFAFAEQSFGDGQEILIFVTELTIHSDSAMFINRYGCDAYFTHNKELLFYERQKELIAQIDELTFDEML